MIVEFLIKDEGRLSVLRTSLDNLGAINMFGALMEVGSLRNLPTPSDKPIENAALRASWHNGYTEALSDLFYFFDRYVIPTNNSPTARPDFGALKDLLASKEITQDEYDKLTRPGPIAE